MTNRLTYICDKVIEAGWLAALVFIPLYFNVYSSRVFEPDKISFLRNIVLVMSLAWAIKQVEGWWLRRDAALATPTGTRRGAPAGEQDTPTPAPEGGLWGRLPGWLRVPLVLPIVLYLVAYIFTSTPLVSVVPLTSLFGSYQRLQGLLSQSAYIVLGLLIIATLRTRPQFERLITFAIATSVPVALYGILQWSGRDPLPWAGDVQSRVASSMGNAIFVAAWLIMVVPLTLSRLLTTLNALRHSNPAAPSPPAERESILPLALIGGSAMALLVLVQHAAMATGDSFVQRATGVLDLETTAGDLFLWVLVLVGLAGFVALSWALAGQAQHPAPRHPDEEDEGSMTWVLLGVAAPVLQIVVLWAALRFLSESKVADFSQWIVLPGAIFIFYALTFLFCAEGRASRMSLLIQALTLPILIVLQGAVIFLSQSRGPQLGLLAGLGVFLLGLVYVIGRAWQRQAGQAARGRGLLLGAGGFAALMIVAGGLAVLAAKIDVIVALAGGVVLYGVLIFGLISWTNRERTRELQATEVGAATGAVGLFLVAVLLLGGLLVVFNLPSSPLARYRDLPYVGRLGTLLQSDVGTGKVRTLIWGGALQMIAERPILGWGPEAMYVGYNKFYPPELAHWELRNATPDRSHDFYIDQMVTMGVGGLLLYLLMAGAFFAYGLLLLRRSQSVSERLITLGLLAMVVAHLVEGLTGIQIAATYTYFYAALGALAVWGYYLTRVLRPQAHAVAETVPVAHATNGRHATNGIASTALDEAEDDGVAHAAEAVPAGAATGRARAGVPAATGAKRPLQVVPPSGEGPVRRVAAPAPGAPPVPGARRTMPAAALTPRPTTGRTGRSAGRVVAPVVLPGLANPPMLIGYLAMGLVALWLMINVNVGVVKADMFYKQGLGLDNASQWWSSITPYDAALKLAPNEDFYYLFLGRAYMEWAKNRASFPKNLPANLNADVPTLLANAEAVLLKAANLNPMNTDHYANLGRLYVFWSEQTKDVGKMGQGVAAYEKAHALSPGNAQIWNELGLAYMKAGNYGKAVEALRGSIAMDDRYALSYFVLGEIDRTQAAQPGVTVTDTQQLAEEATQAYAKAVSLDPNQIQDNAFEQRMTWLSNTHTITPVIAAYTTIVSNTQKASASADANLYVAASSALGYIYSVLGNSDQSIIYFEKALAVQCNDFYNLQNLGMIYRDAGHKTEALSTLRHALAVARCTTADPYAVLCPPIASAASCTPLIQSRPDLTDRLTAVEQEITRLESLP